MRFVLCILVAFALGGCSTPPVSKVQDTINKDYSGKELGEVLSELKSDGYFCYRNKKVESDTRLKAITDGTLDDVEFYVCNLEDSDAFCVVTAGTNVVSQYGKVLRVNGIHQETNCL